VKHLREENDGGVVVGARTSCHSHHALVFRGVLFGQRLQFSAQTQHARVLGGYGTTVFGNQNGSKEAS
jgi:hypothetical protein